MAKNDENRLRIENHIRRNDGAVCLAVCGEEGIVLGGLLPIRPDRCASKRSFAHLYGCAHRLAITIY